MKINLKSFDSFLQDEFKDKKFASFLFFLLGLAVIFMILFTPPNDSDLGWHMKNGEYTWQNGQVPYHDPFSYTMPEFHFIGQAWLTELVMYLLFNFWGPWVLSIIFTLIPLIAYGFLVGRNTFKDISREMQIIWGVFAAFVSFGSLGTRTQTMGVLFLSLFLFIIYRIYRNPNSKVVYFLPPLFLLWVNFHASFFMGLVILAIILAMEKIKINYIAKGKENEWIKKDQTFTLGAWQKVKSMALVSLAVIFINPYSFRIFDETFRTYTDSYGASIIAEWISPNFRAELGLIFAVFIIIFIEILALRKKRIDLTQFILITFLFWFSLQSVRHIPLMVIVTLPFLIESMRGVPERIAQRVISTKFVLIGLFILFVIYAYSPFQETAKAINYSDALAKSGGYPLKALEFLKKNPPQGNMFSEYGWGGYLIWNWPEQKTFIDGRMCFWHIGDRHILKDYIEAASARPGWQDILNKYKVDWVFLKKDFPIIQVLLENPGWEKIYEDDTAVIIVKRN